MQLISADQEIDLSSPWAIVACLLPFIVIGIGWLTRRRDNPKC
jgi:hypothetical protein